MNTLSELTKQILAVCPIEGVSSNGEIQFVPTATSAQRNQAQQLMAAWLALPEAQRKPSFGIDLPEAAPEKLLKRIELLESKLAQLLSYLSFVQTSKE